MVINGMDQLKLVALVLGGTSPHIELIKELRRRYYYVILVDYLENPPARAYADLHIRESTLDINTVQKIAEIYNAKLVISACIDQANSVCCFVAEKLGLPHPYSYETSLMVTNKSKMKKIMGENNIPTTWYFSSKNINQINWYNINYPAVVKPVDCNSSKGVRKVYNIDEAKYFFSKALNYSRSKEALIEGFIDGIEIQVDCFVGEQTTEIVMMREKKQISRDLSEEMNSEGSILPSPKCLGIEQYLKEIGERIASSFGLKNTPFFYQAIIDEEGKLNVLEFAPRIGGGLSQYLLKNLAGFDAIHAVVNSYLGVKQQVIAKVLEHYYSTNLLYMNSGIFDHIEGFEEAKNKGIIKEFFVTKERGASIGSTLRSGNRVGAFIVEADTIKKLKQKENEAYNLINIYDINGKPQMRKWRM